MGLFSVKQPKRKQAEEKDTYYIEPTKDPDEESHEAWEEQERNKGEVL